MTALAAIPSVSPEDATRELLEAALDLEPSRLHRLTAVTIGAAVLGVREVPEAVAALKAARSLQSVPHPAIGLALLQRVQLETDDDVRARLQAVWRLVWTLQRPLEALAKITHAALELGEAIAASAALQCLLEQTGGLH